MSKRMNVGLLTLQSESKKFESLQPWLSILCEISAPQQAAYNKVYEPRKPPTMGLNLSLAIEFFDHIWLEVLTQ